MVTRRGPVIVAAEQWNDSEMTTLERVDLYCREVGAAGLYHDAGGSGAGIRAKLRLVPAESHDVSGGPFPEEWEYRLTLGGPSKTMTHEFVPAQSVLHFRYAADPARPWRGNGPVQVAALAGKLSAETVRALAEESSGPVGRLLGIPVDGEDATVKGLATDILNAKGRVALLETGDWNAAGSDTKVDVETRRFGAEPPASLVELVSVASQRGAANNWDVRGDMISFRPWEPSPSRRGYEASSK